MERHFHCSAFAQMSLNACDAWSIIARSNAYWLVQITLVATVIVTSGKCTTSGEETTKHNFAYAFLDHKHVSGGTWYHHAVIQCKVIHCMRLGDTAHMA